MSSATEYSASVEIWLELAGQCLSVAQVDEHSLILRQETELSPFQYGRIILTIEGEDHIYPVMIRSTSGRKIDFEQYDRLPDGVQGQFF